MEVFNKQFCVRLPEKVYKKLEKYAENKGVHISTVVRDLIYKLLGL